MTDLEIINGNDEICQLCGFESDKVYVYKIPNTFPFESEADTGWTELTVQQTLFHTDWNMLIGGYNRALYKINSMSETAKSLLLEDKNMVDNFGAKNFFGLFEGQLYISSCWIKLVHLSKWYNSVKYLK